MRPKSVSLAFVSLNQVTTYEIRAVRSRHHEWCDKKQTAVDTTLSLEEIDSQVSYIFMNPRRSFDLFTFGVTFLKIIPRLAIKEPQ